MNPVVQIQNPFQCNICFEDKTGHFVKWHLPKKNTERSHQSCLDCATKLCQISFRDQARFAEKVVHCPDCRFKTRVSMMPLMSLEIVFTTFKTSILFYTSKLFCEPTTARYYRSLYPPTELTSLVDSWMLSAPTSETYLFALSHIKQLIQDGTMLPFLHEIYLKSDITRRCGNWFLLSIYLSMCRNLHQANHTDYNHNLLISVLTLQVLFYALYNYCVHVNQMETLSQLDDSILLDLIPFVQRVYFLI